MSTLFAIGAAFCLSASAATAGVSDKVTTGQPAPAGASADISTGQITSGGAAVGSSQVGGGGSAVAAGQISTRGSATAAAQLSPTLHSTTIAGVRDGRDRCDPTAGASAQSAECRNILENKADQFDNGDGANSVQTVDPDASSGALVNDIVNSGTGTVVVAPPH